MEIHVPVIKGREQEALFRRLHQPVPVTVLNGIGQRVITQACLGKLYRTDGALDELVHVFRGVKHLRAVRGLGRDIISTVYEDDIIILTVVIIGNDLIIEFLKDDIIL